MLGRTIVGSTVHLPPVTAPLRPRLPAPACLLLIMLSAAAVVGCSAGPPVATPTRSPSGSPTAGTSGPAVPTATPGEIGTPFVGPWPSGWESAFCALFGEMIVMQELAVDVGRALDEDDRDDALALTRELTASAAAVREELAQLPAWEAAAPLTNQTLELLDLADEMALRYERYLAEGRRPALGLARAAGAAMGEVVTELLDRLILLEAVGLSCPGFDFHLEAPPAGEP
jgi:hypothetical protein